MWRHCIVVVVSILRLTAADQNWRLHGGTQNDQRFSPLNEINERTVSRLGLVWSKELAPHEVSKQLPS